MLCLCVTAVCGPGEQYDSNTASCVSCPLGTWNSGNDTQRFEQCTPCPDGFVTVNEMTGATSIDNCTLSTHSFLCHLWTFGITRSEIWCYIIIVPYVVCVYVHVWLCVCVCVHVCVCVRVCVCERERLYVCDCMFFPLSHCVYVCVCVCVCVWCPYSSWKAPDMQGYVTALYSVPCQLTVLN